MTETIQDTSIANPAVATKYQTAAGISDKALRAVVNACVEGAAIVDLCKLGDSTIDDALKTVYKQGRLAKGIAFPTTVSPNNYICHLSPLQSDPEAQMKLKKGDVVKIALGTHIDGYVANVGTTVVVGAEKDTPVTGPIADAIKAAYVAADATLRLLKPGRENYQVTETVEKIANAYGTTSVSGMMCFQLEKDVFDKGKQIIVNPNPSQQANYERAEFNENEVYTVDIFMTTGDGKPRQAAARTTLFKRTDTKYQLKLKASRAVFAESQAKFGRMPFNIRAMEDEKQARLGIAECVKHDIVNPFDVYVDKDDAIVAEFMFTVMIMPNGPVKITNPPFDASAIWCDKKIEDDQLISLLQSGLKTKKKKKAKKELADEVPQLEAMEESHPVSSSA